MTVSRGCTVILGSVEQHTENPYGRSERRSYLGLHDSCPHASRGSRRHALGEVKRFGHARNVAHHLKSIVNYEYFFTLRHTGAQAAKDESG